MFRLRQYAPVLAIAAIYEVVLFLLPALISVYLILRSLFSHSAIAPHFGLIVLTVHIPDQLTSVFVLDAFQYSFSMSLMFLC